jgi:hypothetical protein
MEPSEDLNNGTFAMIVWITSLRSPCHHASMKKKNVTAEKLDRF